MKKLHVDGSLDSLGFEKFETCEPCLLVYMHEETPCKWTILDSLDFESLDTCKSYHMDKMTESLVFSKMEQESNLFEVIHFDLCSPMSVEARNGYRYVLASQMI